MIHVGIDLYSRNMTLVAINDKGKLLSEEKLTNIPANLERYGQFRQTFQAVVECTSYWHMLLPVKKSSNDLRTGRPVSSPKTTGHNP
jgi:hypothetical protein